MATSNQDRIFAELMNDQVEVTTTVNVSSTLDEAISWISSNLNPDDVFSDKQLESWAANNGYVKE